MNHREAERLFPAYNKGALERAQVREFHAHLKECEICQSRVRMQSTWAKASQAAPDLSLASPETQKAIARNRDLLIKILLLLVFAWAVFRLRH